MNARQHYNTALQRQQMNSAKGGSPTICIAGFKSYYALLGELSIDPYFVNLLLPSYGERAHDNIYNLPKESFCFLGVRIFLSTGKKVGFVFA